MSEALFEEYKNIYKSYFNAELSPAFVSGFYKIKDADKQQDTKLFKNFVLNSREYFDFINQEFEKVYNRLIVLPFDEKYTKDFLKEIKDSVVTTNKIYNYLIKSNRWKESNAYLIETFYKYLTGKQNIKPEITDKYMKNYLENPSYSYETLQKTIVKDENLDHDKIDVIKNEYKDLNGDNIDLKLLLNCINDLNNETKTVQSMLLNKNTFTNVLVKNLLTVFYKVYKRDIHVLEFIKYYPTFCLEQKIVNVNNLTDAVNTEYDKHKDSFNLVKGLYKKYINDDITERDFITMYLDLLDNSNFENIVIEELIAKEEYHKLMLEKIKEIYKNTYSEFISEFDLLYINDYFKKSKFDLYDDKLAKEIINIYELTEEYNGELENIYTNILQREPDSNENEIYITMYREDSNIEVTNTKIEKDLYDSLEYQMVLKELVISIYSETKSTKPMPSTVFNILGKLLSHKDQTIKCDKNKIKEFIKTIT